MIKNNLTPLLLSIFNSDEIKSRNLNLKKLLQLDT
jgi:hypothetical protein